MKKNEMKLEFLAVSENEPFARNAVAAFCLPLSPTVAELSDVRTAISEAVTNCVVHAYGGSGEGIVTIRASIEEGGRLHIEVADEGCGIEDVARALEPFFTTRPDEERSGMGFTIIRTFMEDVCVKSEKGKGTAIEMWKTFGKNEESADARS